MAAKIYVGNLSSDTTKAELETLFKPYGPVTAIDFDIDHNTGQRFAFVEITNAGDVDRAITELNGQKVHGSGLQVHRARYRGRRGTDRGGLGDRRSGLGRSIGGRGTSGARRKADRRKK